MDVTVAICTWNRASQLDRTLARLRALDVPAALRWELLVVDNGSADATPAVLARHAADLPLRALHEPARGLSRARNRAIEAARGDLMLWTDDDVDVERDWLLAYARAARELSESGCFGGPIGPAFESPPPAWVLTALPAIGSAFALCDHGPARTPLCAQRLPFGANFAVRTALQRRFRYDPSLGRRGEQLLSGDEKDVLRKLFAAGHTGTWLPDARVRHRVPRERMTRRYLRRYFRGIGRTDVRMRGAAAAPHASGLAASVAKGCVVELRGQLRRALGRAPGWVEDLRDASIHWGRAEAFLRTAAGTEGAADAG